MTISVDNDELTAFVASTLRAIKAGIDTALPETVVSDAYGWHKFHVPDAVEFDVAVTAKRVVEGGGGLKLAVFSVGVGVEGKAADHHETVSRIRFAVPWGYESMTEPPRPRTGNVV